MSRDDWYRNETWNSQIEADFQQKLKRARNKSQYLRIQASILAKSYPDTALRLIEQYFALGENFDIAQAYVVRANALKVLGDVEGAFLSYEAALEREGLMPNLLTDAYLEFSCLVVEERVVLMYARALEVLETHRDRPVFPIDLYRAFGARAIILDYLGRKQEAGTAARKAIEASKATQSGFRFHQLLGLVRKTEDDFGKRVAALIE